MTRNLPARKSGASLLRSRGWGETRAGRWIDPISGVSFTARRAWEIINARDDGRWRDAQKVAGEG